MNLLTDFRNRVALWLAVFAAALALTVPGQAVFAAPAAKSKVVQALISAAQKEFDAGNFERAGELFLEIYRQDPETKPALYNAARAYQLAGKVDRADELFRELIAAPEMDPALKVKAQNQLDSLQVKRGERKADEADRAEKAGQYSAAAGLWGEAVQLQSAKVAWTLRHARALHLAGQAAAALATYDRYLAATPETNPDRAQVQGWKAELTAKPAPPPDSPVLPPDKLVEPIKAPAPIDPGPVKSVVPVVPPAPAKSPLPLAVMGGSGALLVGGLIVVAVASGDESALLGKKNPATGKFKDITFLAYQAEANRISGNYALGWTLTGLGAIGAGVGAYLWTQQDKPSIAVVPTLTGLALAGRF